MRCIGPVAIARLVGGIDVRVVGDDHVPERGQRLVEAVRSIAAERLCAEEARAARQHAEDDLLREFLIEDQRAAAIARAGDPFDRKRRVVRAEQAEIELARARIVVRVRIVERRHVVVLFVARTAAEQEFVAIVEAAEEGDVVFCDAAAEPARYGGPLRADAGRTVPRDSDVLLPVERCKQHRPGRDIEGRRVERGDRHVGLDEAAIERADIVPYILDIVDRACSIGEERGRRPVEAEPAAQRTEIVLLEADADGRAAGRRTVGRGRPRIHAVRGEDDGARIDQRARAGPDRSTACIGDDLADAGDVDRIEDAGGRRLVGIEPFAHHHARHVDGAHIVADERGGRRELHDRRGRDHRCGRDGPDRSAGIGRRAVDGGARRCLGAKTGRVDRIDLGQVEIGAIAIGGRRGGCCRSGSGSVRFGLVGRG